ncbi:hypothetical protein ATK74_1408 [Propionicimonas paludicola]|uniref:Antitoxin FitA-like ribbon-helix-helix domain-containing protein n=2 Tax=Propionicimonas paludicola TaxID=185243 RepID=A0A2A9CR08_9ACTN|nr:hypothetical protein ATK74_1408 [Propionicimonas paludicola]
MQAPPIDLSLKAKPVGGCQPAYVRKLPVYGDERWLPLWRRGSHNGSMPNIQIKDVPEDTHAVLRQRASQSHQSLQEYLRSRLIAEAAQPTLDEVLARAGGRAGGSLPLADAVSALRFDRARH